MNRHTLISIFKDSDGRIVIWQTPNLILTGWILCKVTALLIDNSNLETSISHLSNALLFTWAYLEIRSGVNMFRKLLGLTVLCFVLTNIF